MKLRQILRWSVALAPTVTLATAPALGADAPTSTVAATAATAPSTTAADTSVDNLTVPSDLEVRTWALTPQLFNPTNIDIDARGRIWVAEAVNYRETIHPLRALKHPAGDRVMILEDTDGDGTCDSSKTFVQEKDLTAPLGVAVLGNKVVVSCSPNLFVYTDTDGDDRADQREVLLTGFGGFDNDHGLHAVTGFLDGRWYFNVGNQGPHEVRDASGWTLRGGSSYGGPPNLGNRKSDDGRIWTGGAAFRIDPDGRKLTPLAHNFRNSYEVALDSFGDIWQSDNDDDGNRSTRVSWVMEGGNYGYSSADGTRAWQADRRPGQETPIAHWRQEDPGVMPSGDITGAGGPTGVLVYDGGALGEQYLGSMLDADALANCVYVHRPVADGAGFRLERDVLIKVKPDAAGERAKWFRPSDIAIGPDGALYISDWYDPMVGGHDMRDKKGLGRILRVSKKGSAAVPAKVDLETLDGQLAALDNPAVNVRYAAAIKLPAAGEEAVKRLLQRVSSNNPRQRARAIWVLARCGNAGAEAVERIAAEGDASDRLVAFRALRSIDRNVLRHAARLAADESPAVRREVAVALRDVPFEQCRDLLVKLADGYDGRDRFYLEAFGIACDGKESAVYPILLERLGSGDPLKWSEAMANLAWRLHPVASLDALAARGGSAELSPDARRRAVNALAFIRHERAATAMAALGASGPQDVRPLAQWWLKNRGGNEWKAFAPARAVAEAPAEQPDRRRDTDRATMLNPSAPIRDRRNAAGRLARRADGALIIIGHAADGTFPRELTDAVSDALHRNGDFAVRALASQYFPRTGAGGAPLPPIKELAAMKGDAARGRAVFFGATAACIRCHSFDGQGQDIGPDLTAVRSKFPRAELLDNILNPSAAIAFGYEPWIVKTRGGQVYSGFIRGDGETVELKESSGEQRSIPAGEITLRKKQPFSVMPDNVSVGLSAQDLADVAEFLLASPIRSAPSAAATQPVK